MELDQLDLDEITRAARVIDLLGHHRDIEAIEECIRILDAVTYSYRRAWKKLQGDHNV